MWRRPSWLRSLQRKPPHPLDTMPKDPMLAAPRRTMPTMKRVALGSFVLALTTLSACGSGDGSAESAADSKTNTSPGTRVVEHVDAALRVAEWGRDHRSALALAAAAEILGKTRAGGGGLELVGKSQDGAADEDPLHSAARRLHEEALRMLDNDPTRLRMATLPEAPAKVRGKTGGPSHVSRSISAGAEDTLEFEYRGLERAIVVLQGNSQTDLDLYVYDPNGNLVVSETNQTDSCSVRWTPRWTGKHRIVIKNQGATINSYLLITN